MPCRRPLLSIDRVRAFVAVAQCGSFREAARRIHLSQPAVSMAVRALEQDLGRALFEKAGRGRRLTVAGEALAEIAAPMLDRWHAVPDELESRLDGVPRGLLRIGAGEAVSLYFLPRLLADFRRAHRLVGLRFRVESRSASISGLIGAELDLAVRSAGAFPASLVFAELFRCRRVIIAGTDSVLPARPALSTLAACPFVAPPAGSRSRSLLEASFASEGLQLEVGAEAGGWETLKALVHAGLGVALVPAFCLTPTDRRRLRVLSPRPAFPAESYGVVRRGDRDPGPTEKAFCDMLTGAGGPPMNGRRRRKRTGPG